VQLTPHGDGDRTEASAAITVEVAPVGNAKPQLRTLTPQQALDRFGVQWALLPKSGMNSSRAAVEGLGFLPAWTDASYTLFQRGAP
ncbi:MAG: hypothetical protein LC624_07845, partial [Halobacteriales archaeon]|nr:hypothetical protein [Halobacteriales archaeon]